MSDLNVDSIIERLLAANNLSPGTLVQLLWCEIDQLVCAARDVLMAQPMLLELSAPLAICGDVHGQYADLLRIFGTAGLPPDTRYLFLGDYVDRGPQSIETMCLLLALKVKHPLNIFLLRGNHESACMNRRYGFKAECKNRYDSTLWRRFVDCFNCLPVAALIENKVFCCHGGLSPLLHSLDQIRSLGRPTPVPKDGLMCDLLWADPEPNQNGWAPNGRGVSLTFGEHQVHAFLDRFDMDLVVRAHQVVQDGYEFFAQRRLVTVFSAPNYCSQFDNDGAILTVDSQLLCSFLVLRPQKTTNVT